MNYPPVSLVKRLLAIIYDLLLLIALFFVVGIIVSSVTTFLVNQGNAITETHDFYIAHRVIVLLALFLTSLFFYSWFWCHGGQTLGMKTWKIQLLSDNDCPVTLKQALIRYCMALVSWAVFGLGFIWVLVDKNKRSWHDIASHTHLIQLS